MSAQLTPEERAWLAPRSTAGGLTAFLSRRWVLARPVPVGTGLEVLEQLAGRLDAVTPLQAALWDTAEATHGPARQVARRLAEHVAQGGSLETALEDNTGVFSPGTGALVAAYAHLGPVSAALRRAAATLRDRGEMRARWRRSRSVAAAMVTELTTLVASAVVTLGPAVPAASNWRLWSLVILTCLAWLAPAAATLTWRALPRRADVTWQQGRVLVLLADQVRSGVPAATALDRCSSVAAHPNLRQDLRSAASAAWSGQSLSQSLAQTTSFVDAGRRTAGLVDAEATADALGTVAGTRPSSVLLATAAGVLAAAVWVAFLLQAKAGHP